MERKQEKELENMTERELLIELARQQRKAARNSRLTAMAAVALALVFAVLLLAAVPVVRQAESALDRVNELTENLNCVISGNADSVTKALDQLSQLDIESLNRSIQNLAKILSPLSQLLDR